MNRGSLAGRGLLWPAAIIGATTVAFTIVWAAEDVQFVARGLLVGVLVLAGVAKTRDPESFARTLRDFGIRGHWGRTFAGMLPLIELSIAAAMLVPVSSFPGVIAAFCLLSAFTAVVAVALARGVEVGCGCFGSDSSRPLSRITLLRNGILLGLAGALVLGGAQGARVSLLAAAVAVIVVGGVVVVRRAHLSAGELEASVAGQAIDSSAVRVTRGQWFRTAAGLGVATTMGSWFDLINASPAGAVLSKPTLADTIVCPHGCSCCRLTFGPNGPICLTYCCDGCTGFSGGGVVETPTGSANASFSGNNVKLKDKPDLATTGGLTWFDSGWQTSGLLLEGIQVTSYGRVSGTNMRELVGYVSANGKGKHRFVLHVTDEGRPGSGTDVVNLTVNGIPGGGAGGTSKTQYHAVGHLSQGNISTSLQIAVSTA